MKRGDKVKLVRVYRFCNLAAGAAETSGAVGTITRVGGTWFKARRDGEDKDITFSKTYKLNNMGTVYCELQND